MKDYFYRISHGCKKWELVYWWILRATMIFAMVDAAVGLGRFGFGIEESVNIQQVLQTFANFVGMFAWEICLLFSKKRWPRYVTPLFQDGLILLLWLASFGGAYINFYYSVNSYDYIMHAALGFWAVIIGYEIATSIILILIGICLLFVGKYSIKKTKQYWEKYEEEASYSDYDCIAILFGILRIYCDIKG